jgi:hypothetical protein
MVVRSVSSWWANAGLRQHPGKTSRADALQLGVGTAVVEAVCQLTACLVP